MSPSRPKAANAFQKKSGPSHCSSAQVLPSPGKEKGSVRGIPEFATRSPMRRMKPRSKFSTGRSASAKASSAGAAASATRPAFPDRDHFMRAAVVVPCYNEERRLRLEGFSLLLERVELYFVDNGSVDGTGALLAEFCSRERRAHLLSASGTGGKAEAVRRGLLE